MEMKRKNKPTKAWSYWLLALVGVLFFNGANAQDLKSDVEVLANFDFDTTKDKTGQFSGELKNGASIDECHGMSVLKLGKKDGYFDLSSEFGSVVAQLEEFSISTNMFIPNSSDIGGAGSFVWTFANSTDMASTADGNTFFAASSSRYAISKMHWTGESSLSTGKSFPKGRWINLTYTHDNGKGSIYIDGKLLAQGDVKVQPKDLGATKFNFLGKSCYNGDRYLSDATFDNFTVYSGVLLPEDMASLAKVFKPINHKLDSIAIVNSLNEFELEGLKEVRSNLILPKAYSEGVSISWKSSNNKVIDENGYVKRPSVGSEPVKVSLTATFKNTNVSASKDIEVTVIPQVSAKEAVVEDLESLQIEGTIHNVRSAVQLPYKTLEGSRISWKSKNPEFINDFGQVVKLSEKGKGKQKVVLTAYAVKGEEKSSKDFELWIAEDEGYEAYLFSYFTGNDTNGEQIRLALSYDGYNYMPINDGNRIISSDTISLKGGVRDPHILRGADGTSYYMVVTDMKSAEGWSSNRGMVLLKSNDLINWTHSTVHFPEKWPEAWGNVKRVWAPQTIYDADADKYMVYFSLTTFDADCPYDRIYYCYANEDFTDLEGEPKLFYDRKSSTIDCDIVFNEVDSLYYMFFKNEAAGGISRVTAKTLLAPEGEEPGSQWSRASSSVQPTYKAVEGAGIFRLINSDKWVLMYDCYANGHYQYCSSDDLTKFKHVRDSYDIHARHGTTIPIYKEELERLLKKWPNTKANTSVLGAANNKLKNKSGFEINEETKEINLKVAFGTDLSNFNPGLYGTPGSVIKPQGEQDFTSGSIKYTVSHGGKSESYNVSVSIAANPVLPGFHADPDVLYSEKTGRFYIYPTSDGYPGWGGYSFDVFSSPDLVNWVNEGTFLDLSTDQVSWASGNAWAPCIEEKKMADGSYKYFYYFSGNAGIKKIGVAVANDPTGPFYDSGVPMISKLPKGIGGQLIDGDVFTDPVSGKSYFYYGNGYMAVAELNEDMITIKESTVKDLTPRGGSLKDYAYREAPYVFYRKGLYYFLWSVDDTGSPNYHVAYGTSKSPTGPVEVAEDPIVIIQDAKNKIYGTAHNSILQIPGKDEWYIVYHRINAKHIKDDPGTHREVCIDQLLFNEDGTIKRALPTHKGIDPVMINKEKCNSKKKKKHKKKK